MSTTRKIVVWVKPHPDGHFCPTSRLHPDYAEKPDGTLIVGGKAFTDEEVKALVVEIFLSRQHFELSGGLPGMLIQPGDVEQIAAKHGIKL